MTWAILILAAGRGSRMKHLTANQAKPSLAVGRETLISRLIRQVSNSSIISEIYVNCSYRAETIIAAIPDLEGSRKVQILWESEPLGTSRSLLAVGSRIKCGVLAIHGDLFLHDAWLEELLQDVDMDSRYSYIVTHRRKKKVARSEVIIKNTLVTSICHPDLSGSKGLSEEIWSNSGIYFVQNEHLREIDFESLGKEEVVEGILQTLVTKGRLKAITFKGLRYSLESPEDFLDLETLLNNPLT